MSAIKLHKSKSAMRRERDAYRAVLTQVGIALGLRGQFGARQIVERAQQCAAALPVPEVDTAALDAEIRKAATESTVPE